MSKNDAELLELFIQETREHLAQLEPDLMALEQEKGNPELVNRIFRAVHSIKGSAGFFGIRAMNDLSHVMEDCISRIRDGLVTPVRDMVDTLLAGKDKLAQMLDNLDHSEEVDFSAEKSMLKRFMDVSKNGRTECAPPGEKAEGHSTDSAPSERAAAAASLGSTSARFHVTLDALQRGVPKGRFLYQVELRLAEDVEKKNKTIPDTLKTFSSLGRILDSTVELLEFQDLKSCLDCELSWTFLFSTVLESELVLMGLEVPEERVRKILPSEYPLLVETGMLAPVSLSTSELPVPVAIAPPAAPGAQPRPLGESGRAGKGKSPLPAAKGPPAHGNVTPAGVVPKAAAVGLPDSSPRRPGQAAPLPQTGRATTEDTIRVRVAILDDLMNLAGEMVLGRNQLLRMAASDAKDIPGLPALLQSINLVTSELQEKVMHTRMQPLDSVFSKFPRIVRDMSHKLGKEIDLKLGGEEVELDKSIIEGLSDPLTHLIRNCVDHAIETPEIREQAGKNRIGSIRLSAYHEGGQVHIEVTDDGRGIDAEKIKRKAVEKGFLTQEDAAKLHDREALSLIFLPGLSTAEKITDVSGRGVGMDVVKSNIEKMGGSVDLESEMGKGACVRLRLPLTLAIIPSMVMTAQGRRFAVPQVSLEELVRINERVKIEKVRQADVIRLRGKLLPLVNLKDLLGLHSPEARAEGVPTLQEVGMKPEFRSSEKSEIQNPKSKIEEAGTYVLVLKAGTHRYGLVVDQLIDTEEIVVKPLSNYLKQCKCYAGATIMGDGKVAMILDAAGVAEFAKLRFADLEHEEVKLGMHSRAKACESQPLVVFRNASQEIFALNLAMVSRIEKVKTSQIEHVGGREYLTIRNESLRIIRLHDFMPVARPEHEPDSIYIITPKLVRHPMGIVATQIDDVIDLPVTLDRNSVTGPGILGSAVINDKLTVFIDIYELFEAADPEIYGWKKAGEALSGKRILLAEDTAFFRTIEAEYLDEFGCQVDVAPDGMQAWEKLNKNSYDILLTDIEMPGMDGFELAQRVRASEKLKKLPVVALTALTSSISREKGFQAGVDAYETKLDKEHLRDTMERLLTRAPPG
ncbi:MAG: chemotaxis protein CheW [Lentisphaerae bacterium]|nr:chemotaxis protein CheW [Lentisphaerota bacterium]